MGLGGELGNFEPGKRFDALVVDPAAACSRDAAEGGHHHHGDVSGASGDDADGRSSMACARDAAASRVDIFEGDSAREAFEKWIYCGDDRNIVGMFVDGIRVK